MFEEYDIEKLNQLHYLTNFLPYLKQKFEINYDNLKHYFLNEFDDESYFPHRKKTTDGRLTEMQFVRIMPKIILRNKLHNEVKTKEELIEIIKKEELDDIFCMSLMAFSKQLIGGHLDTYKRYIYLDYYEKMVTNIVGDNIQKMLSLYCSDYQNENLTMEEIMNTKKVFYSQFLMLIMLIRDWSNTRIVFLAHCKPLKIKMVLKSLK